MKKIFLGPPGSGKGTAASRIAPEFSIPHISTGDLFREHIRNSTEIGKKSKESYDKGELVQDDIAIEVLKKRIGQEDCKNGFILDGFPRTIYQAEKLNELTGIDLVIIMNVPDEIIIKRLSSRISCSDCKKIYNLRNNPPQKGRVCDECGGKVIGRKDDEPETIKNRLEIYQKQTQPLIEFYKNKGNVIEIICNNIDQTSQETAEQVLNEIKKFLKEAG